MEGLNARMIEWQEGDKQNASQESGINIGDNGFAVPGQVMSLAHA
jgi:hypothetical protein